MSRLREQEGFTLPELLIAIVLSMVIFGATLDALMNYTHFWQGDTQQLDAQDNARLGIDRIVRQLRNIASPVTSPKLLERATPYDIVFQTVGSPSGSNTSGAERVRYCIPQDTSAGSSSKEVLIGEVQTWNTATPPASPWNTDPSVTIACPDSPLPSGVSSSVVIQPAVTNRQKQRSDRPAFTFNNSTAPSDLSQVFTVQIDLFVNPTPTNTTAESELRSGAFLRNQPRAPVAAFTYTPTQGGGVLLNGAPSYSPDGLDLNYSWSCTSSPCPSTSALTDSQTGLVDWNPGAGTYTIKLTVTDSTGLTATATQDVTVT